MGSSVSVQEQLALNASSVIITAGTEESTSRSSEQTYSAGMSFSNSAGNSFSANASANSSDSDSYSKTHINSSIKAGSLTSTSDQFTLQGGNVEIQNDIDIITGQLTIASLQDESRSRSSSEGYNMSGSVGGNLPIDPSNVGGNQSSSSSDSKWVNNQTTLIGGASGNGSVTITADKTDITGATVASAKRNEDGTLTDNVQGCTNAAGAGCTGAANGLTLITDELTITNLYDHNTSESSGVNLSAGVSSSGTTTVGLTNNGHNTQQTTYATLGGGTVQKKDGTAHNLADVNTDLSNTQEITLDQQTGGLDATVTVDHRLASEQGRAKIQEDFTKSGMIVDTVTLIATTDRVGITDFFKETGKSHTTYEAIKSEIANNPELAAQLARDDLTPTEKEAMLNQLTHRVMVDLGYSTGDYQNVLVANEQDHVVKDGVTYERHGFYSEETQNAYINDAFISNTQGLVTTAGHELSHAMDDRSGTQHSKQDNEIYATQYGNNFGNYTNVAMAVTGNGSMAGNNQHVGNNSEKVRSQTEGYNQLDKGQGDDLVFLAAPAAPAAAAAVSATLPTITPAAVTAIASLATVIGLKVNEDNIAEMLGVEGKPTSYITPEHTANADDTRLEGSAIVQGEATILATPVHQDNYGLLVNIPVGLDVNSNSGGYQPHPISLDDLVMMAENSNHFSRTSMGEGDDFYQADPNSREYYWPENLGFSEKPKPNTLDVGAILDRYGENDGSFLSPEGIPFEQRALGPGDGSRTYRRYEVLKQLPVLEGGIAPAFGKIGGGTQYLSNLSDRVNIDWLIDNGYLKELK